MGKKKKYFSMSFLKICQPTVTVKKSTELLQFHFLMINFQRQLRSFNSLIVNIKAL